MGKYAALISKNWLYNHNKIKHSYAMYMQPFLHNTTVYIKAGKRHSVSSSV